MNPSPLKGRGAISRREGRFAERAVDFDEAEAMAEPTEAPATELRAMRAKSIISHNQSPDVPFKHSINPYQGCEHGCIYCYARPSHSYLDLSPGLDFETRVFYKPEAAKVLLETWEKPGYVCEPVTIGANTDPYQPAEKSLGITRQLLETFAKHRHPVSLITKGTLIERDLDLLSSLAADNLCSVAISLPTMNRDLKRIMEPRVPSAEARLNTIRALKAAGVPVSALVAPIIPAINDNEIEAIIAAVADAGVSHAAYIFLRLPHEVSELFTEWLNAHYPDRAEHVMSLVRQASGGKTYDHRFGRRQRGKGPYADMIASRFKTACRKAGVDAGRYHKSLDCSLFDAPGQHQLGLNF